MSLKEKIELELLRGFAGRIVDILDKQSNYSWRDELKADVRAKPVAFDLNVDYSDEDLNKALEEAFADVAARLGLNREDIQTIH